MKTILPALITSVFFFSISFLNAQTMAPDNKLSQTITFRPIPKGPSVIGVFQGRPPCTELAKQLKISIPVDCIKLKWSLALYRDSLSAQPSAFSLLIVGGGDIVKQDGDSFYQTILHGKWKIAKGTETDPGAAIYALQFDNSKVQLYLFKGDENVLFVLDENKKFRIGNEVFSYTLNRVELVPGRKK